MADNDFPTLISATTAVNAATNPIFAQLSDGTDTVNVTAAGELEVTLTTALPAGANNIGDVDVLSVIPGTGATNAGKAVDSAGGATDTGSATLVLRDDVLTTLTPVDGDYVRLRVTSTGALWTEDVNAGSAAVQVDDTAFTPAVSSVSMSGYFVDETATDTLDEGDGGAARVDASRRQLIRVVGATDTQRLDVNASGQALVESHQTTHDDLNANANLQVGDTDVSTTVPVPVSATTAQNTETNPIFVQNVTTGVSASEVHDFDTAAAVAGGATDNHDYTVVNTTFLLKQVDFASSGALKVEIQTGPVASLVTVFVGFIAKQGGEGSWDTHHTPREVPVTSTGTVRIIRTNREGSANDVYSTIIGNDV